MRLEDLKAIRDKEPFQPFRIVLTDGKGFEIPHRDFLIVTKHVIEIGLRGDIEIGIPEELVRCSPLHIVRVEPLTAAA